MTHEPRVTDDDRRIWDSWCRAALGWSRTDAHRRRVDTARRAVEHMAAERPDAYVAWSAGKDSTALLHLAAVDRGVGCRAMSVKSDLAFPGEVEYLARWAGRLGVQLDLLHPGFSLQQYLVDHRIRVNEPLHGKAAAFCQLGFLDVIDGYRMERGTPGVYLGMRKEESRGRMLNVMSRGIQYTKNDGEAVCQPLAHWRGIDVYAYLLSRDVELFDVYRCVRLHETPDRVRLSWWVPGSHSRKGATVWLRCYYPSLYRRLCDIDPLASAEA